SCGHLPEREARLQSRLAVASRIVVEGRQTTAPTLRSTARRCRNTRDRSRIRHANPAQTVETTRSLPGTTGRTVLGRRLRSAVTTSQPPPRKPPLRWPHGPGAARI